MSTKEIEEALKAFESQNGAVSEANGFETVMKSGCLGCCDAYKCQME